MAREDQQNNENGGGFVGDGAIRFNDEERRR